MRLDASTIAIGLPEELRQLLQTTPELAQAYLVGGCVRDALLGLPQKDFDLEVFGVSGEQLEKALSRRGKTDLVGRSFGVIKMTLGKYEIDFSLPRRDSKIAPGHQGFAVTFDPHIPLPEAASRRDFTINSLMFDPRRQQLLDFFGGTADLEKKILRHTSPAFIEDPLRVLRGMQFAARFQLQPAPETVALCRNIKSSFSELATERVLGEWRKWAEKSATPSLGLKFLTATEWVDHFPELKATIGIPQEPAWHPEGDVFTHTCHCCDALVNLPEWQQSDAPFRLVSMLTVLLHDIGKAVTTQRAWQNGRERITSPGHESAGVPLAEKFLERIRAPLTVRERVLPLIQNHMAHGENPTDRSVRRLAHRLAPATIPDLCVVMTADAHGRPPRSPQIPRTVTALLAKAEKLRVQDSAPKPILLGRHLLELGFQPGPAMGKILAAAYNAQLDGVFLDWPQALQWLKNENVTAETSPRDNFSKM